MSQLPFIPGQIYQRKYLHDQYGGSRQSGICPTSNYPYIFIFSGSRGKEHGYKDQWENSNVFSYTGEGQVGDMQFTRGNLALRDHLENGKRVFLFEYDRVGYVKFEGELTLFDFDYYETHDTNGENRIGIKFFFHRTGVQPVIGKRELELSDGIAADPSVLYNVPEHGEEGMSHQDLLDASQNLPLMLEDPGSIYEYIKPSVTERSGLVNSRVGQGAYRKSILHRWEYKCGITDFSDIRILIASHIVPWKKATDEQRLDVDNGILLSPTYDALFDRHLITFDQNGKIHLSDSIETDAFQQIGVTGQESLKRLSQGMLGYLEEHQRTFEEVGL